MINCLIIDDEFKGRVNVAEFVHRHCKELKIIGQAASVKEAVELIQSAKPQLIFLDIEMKDGTGFDVLTQCKNISFEIIFVTAYDHYSLDAIKFSAIDYILKPIEETQFIEAVEKAIQQINLKSENIRLRNLLYNATQNNANKRIALPFVDSIEFVEVKNIIRLEADGSYTRFIISNGNELLVSGSLKEYDEMLSSYGFIRTHQAHLINPEFIKSLKKSDGGYLTLLNGNTVPISRLRKAEIINVLKGS